MRVSFDTFPKLNLLYGYMSWTALMKVGDGWFHPRGTLLTGATVGDEEFVILVET